MPTLLDPQPQKKFLQKLLLWYRKHGRHDMPWRKTRDAYAVFISEFMLQQTTVSTVRPYYERFLKKFPTITSLANGDLNDVLALWSGLGYYARARNLWAAMHSIETEFNGRIPSEAEQLEKLPGVGPYTAGAIVSFAYNKPAVVLDANIIRVLMRLLAIEDDPKLKAVQILLRKTAFDLNAHATRAGSKTGGKSAGGGGPRALNLALMDLGSLICLPQNPKCAECPGAAFCLGRLHGRQNDIPLKGEKIERPTVRRLYAAIHHRGKWLMAQRPKEGLFGGLWEFPGVDAAAGIEPVLFLEEAVQREIGLRIRVREAIPAFEHQLSHRIFVVRSFYCEPYRSAGRLKLGRKSENYLKYQWVLPSRLKKLGISSITKRIIGDMGQLLPKTA